jgi:phage terminase small subunit
MAKMAKLTEKQQRFVDEYLIDLNATQAAIRAGYSVDTAKEIGYENLTKPHIQKVIAERMAERSKRTGVNQDRIVEELAKIAFVNIEDVVDTDTGEILPNASKDDLACIESVKFKQSDNQYGGSIEREVKLASKMKALELLGKHLGMWNDKLDVNITQPIVITGEDALED